MADTYVGPDSARVILPSDFPPAAAARMAASLLNRHSPHEIAEAIEVLVDVLDLLGGDPDLDLNGDEQDTGNAEDELTAGAWAYSEAPGCPISDPDSAVDDRPCDPDTDAEIETWSHWMDHPPELHVGKRPGWNDGPEAA